MIGYNKNTFRAIDASRLTESAMSYGKWRPGRIRTSLVLHRPPTSFNEREGYPTSWPILGPRRSKLLLKDAR
jgi:hypothetical protein